MQERGRCNFIKSKSGQMTIFIIMAILIVGIIGTFFVFKKGIPELGQRKELNPNLFLKTCIEDKVSESVRLITKGGSYIETPTLSKKFKFSDEESFNNITYLCYTRNYFRTCVNQRPMLMKNTQNEIKEYLIGDMELCFNNLVSSLKKQNYEVSHIDKGII